MSICVTGKSRHLRTVLSSPWRKNKSFDDFRKSEVGCARPASLERGAFRPIVTTRGVRDAMDALATRTIIRADERRRCGRKSVWSWPPDAEAKSVRDDLA